MHHLFRSCPFRFAVCHSRIIFFYYSGTKQVLESYTINIKKIKIYVLGNKIRPKIVAYAFSHAMLHDNAMLNRMHYFLDN